MELQIEKREVYDLRKEKGIYNDYKEKFFRKLEKLKTANDKEGIKKLLNDKTEEEWKKYYDDYLNKIDEKINEFETQSEKTYSEKKSFGIDRNQKRKFLEETNTSSDVLKRIRKGKKEVIKEEIAYTIYKTTKYGGMSNFFVENLTFLFTKKYPKEFNDLSLLIQLADIKILSKTYASMMIFSSFLAYIGFFFFYLAYTLITGSNVIVGLIKSIPLGFLALITTGALFYFYPYVLIGNRKKAIKDDLPFVIIHMAAIAGSGAPPFSIFNLILNSGEYKGLEGEIKKIVNYVNLFGYDMSTALKAVSLTTPSPEFKELLVGLIAATESGGDLKSYLKGKANDSLNTYKLERKRYVESLATYSDIYTAVLIAAPLLFMTTLAIINVIGGNIGGISVKTISTLGTYIALPIMNIIFLVFLSVIQPKT